MSLGSAPRRGGSVRVRAEVTFPAVAIRGPILNTTELWDHVRDALKNGCHPANARQEMARMVSAMNTATPAQSIDDVATLRAGYGVPSERAVKKLLPALDHHMREFIALSPLLVLGTSSEGGADV